MFTRRVDANPQEKPQPKRQKGQKNKNYRGQNLQTEMARQEGIEPPTDGFGIRCATNCATGVQRGAHDGTRIRDLFLTKEVLYQLSYMGGQANDKITSRELCKLSAHRINPHQRIFARSFNTFWAIEMLARLA